MHSAPQLRDRLIEVIDAGHGLGRRRPELAAVHRLDRVGRTGRRPATGPTRPGRRSGWSASRPDAQGLPDHRPARGLRDPPDGRPAPRTESVHSVHRKPSVPGSQRGGSVSPLVSPRIVTPRHARTARASHRLRRSRYRQPAAAHADVAPTPGLEGSAARETVGRSVHHHSMAEGVLRYGFVPPGACRPDQRGHRRGASPVATRDWSP